MTDISKEYASALFELAREISAEKEFLEALFLIQAALKEQPEYVTVLSSPNLSVREKKSLLEKAFASFVPEPVLSFAELLCEKGHMSCFHDCVKEYQALYQTFCSVSSARVVSAVALTEEEKRRLTEKLEKISGHRVQTHYETDEAILGGLIVYMDDTVIDGSLRRQLKDVRDVIGT